MHIFSTCEYLSLRDTVLRLQFGGGINGHFKLLCNVGQSRVCVCVWKEESEHSDQSWRCDVTRVWYSPIRLSIFTRLGAFSSFSSGSVPITVTDRNKARSEITADLSVFKMELKCQGVSCKKWEQLSKSKNIK